MARTTDAHRRLAAEIAAAGWTGKNVCQSAAGWHMAYLQDPLKAEYVVQERTFDGLQEHVRRLIGSDRGIDLMAALNKALAENLAVRRGPDDGE